MKTNFYLKWLVNVIIIIIWAISNHSQAKQTHPISEKLRINQLHHTNHQWTSLHAKPQNTPLKLTAPVVIAGVLSFIAAAISCAGGTGGGGLFVPILTLVAGLNLKTASSFSAFMVTGGSFANVMCSMFIASPKHGGKTLIDYDIALLSEPCMLLGVSIGVICHLVFPEWLILILFDVFLAWSSFMTCKSGVMHWKLESKQEKENELIKDEAGNVSKSDTKNADKSVSTEEGKRILDTAWIKIGILIMVWLSFFVLQLLRGNLFRLRVMHIKPCGAGYWIISSIQIPLAIIFTTWTLYRRRMRRLQNETSKQQEKYGQAKSGAPNIAIFPIMALLAGFLGGVFGIGGGMLISPILLQLGISPEVTAATCSFMVFFSSTMSAIQHLLLGMEHIYSALVFTAICFFAALTGLMVVRKVIQKYGRASLIVFSLGIVMVLSTVLLTTFGALDIRRNCKRGIYMGFNKPCQK